MMPSVPFTLCLALLLSARCCQSWGASTDSLLGADPERLREILETEIDATKQQLELYRRKTQLINETLAQIRLTTGVQAPPTTKPQRRPQRRDGFQLFRDWFEPQKAFPLSGDATTKSPGALAQLISFRLHASPLGKRQQPAPRRKASGLADEAPLQFVLELDPLTTVMRLYHPTTHELLWQHALNLRATPRTGTFEVADMFFLSERSAHLAILSASGELALFKLRLWHSRRVVSGDPRRLPPTREAEEAQLQCLAGQDDRLDSEASPFPWLRKTASSVTTPPLGKYLHVDVERVFSASLNADRSYRHGKVTAVALYNRVLVVLSDGSGRHISLFNGDNGDFVADVQVHGHDGALQEDSVVQLQPVQNGRGLVALMTRRRIFFVDPNAPQQLPVACEAPERHDFVSLAVDPLRPYVVYAGSSRGRAFVYQLHNVRAWRHRADERETDGRAPAFCALVDQLMPKRPPVWTLSHERLAVVQTMPGFLVLGAGSRLVLYQLSASSDWVHPTYLSEYSLAVSPIQEVDEAVSASSQHPRVLGISAAKDLVVHSVGFAVLVGEINGDDSTGVTHRLEIFESRIPPPGANLDLSWVRIPAMMICALAAMFWQQKGRMAYSAGGRSGFDEAELVNMLGGRGGRTSSLASMKRGGLNPSSRVDWH